MLRAAVVLFQSDHYGPRKIVLEVQDVAEVRSAPTLEIDWSGSPVTHRFG